MLATYNRPQRARQHKSLIPMPSHDGPQPEELRARRLQNRFGYSPEVAAQVQALAFAIPEKEARA